MESYILTKSMHLGYIKESFGRGSVIRFDPDNSKLTIDGRKFDDYRDLDVLKRQVEKNPESPWIVPYTEESLKEINGLNPERRSPTKKESRREMEVVKDDADTHEEIDISDTKISERNRSQQEADKQRTKDEGPGIIKGDEGSEERIARLKDKEPTDMSARAERVRIMQERKAEMPVVHDDSLGEVGGSKSSALNAGSKIGGRKAEASESAEQKAERRKKEVEKRRAVAKEQGLNPDDENLEVMSVPETSSNENDSFEDNSESAYESHEKDIAHKYPVVDKES